jgi:predicted aspartyl protease
MRRIVASVRIDSVSDPGKSLRCDALVDTGASYMILPSAWRDRLFIDMTPDDGAYELLIGHVVLEQCQAAVDIVGHRLVKVSHTDLKRVGYASA